MTDRTVRRARGLRLSKPVTRALRAQLPGLASQSVAAITVEVPAYADDFAGRMGRTIENAVQVALGAFLTMAEHAGAGTPLAPALEAAHALGRGEARSGRSLDALLAAYRVGARVSWREMSATALAHDVPARTLAAFAELIFAYIDELSAASAAGHAEQLAASGRARQRALETLGRRLLAGAPETDLRAAAELAQWPVPKTLTAVLVPISRAATVRALLPEHALDCGEDAGAGPEVAVLLAPDVHGKARGRLLRAMRGQSAAVGPDRPWVRADRSFGRALRALAIGDASAAVIDSEAHLVELVLAADLEALADLRTSALAPLSGLRPSAAEKLTETLRAWLLHRGNREAIAAELFVHPQTVRYRMGQLRELFGERLDQPRAILELTVALALPPGQS